MYLKQPVTSQKKMIPETKVITMIFKEKWKKKDDN